MPGEEDGAHFAVTVKAGIRSSGGRRVGVTLERGERESWMEGGRRQGAVSTLRERMFFACGSSRTTAEEE